MNAATTPMQQAVARYLEDRRRLGFALTAPATELARFARYADAREHRGPLTQELMLGWAREHVHRTSDVTAARRLEIVLPFAAYYRQFEPGTQIPPKGILGRAHRRLAPHIYTDQEIIQLLDAAGQLSLTWPLRALTYRSLFGLIAAAGLRLSEALMLTLGDVDLQAAALTVRQTKFHKSRRLPLHPSTVRELERYRQARDRCHSTDDSAPFFVSHDGGQLPARTVENVFRRLQPGLDWRARGDHPYPRIHDLRHTMAVRRLQRWRESGQSIEHAMFWLCTYLGHAKISDTYWYLSGIPELMDTIGARFERFVGVVGQGGA
ncbi:MAG TPA: tyrosine-type recombinase/integrase [Rubrivivax sp.]|nr:tyrosine-type recombinase/integrase [Rubrivivax sp.]